VAYTVAQAEVAKLDAAGDGAGRSMGQKIGQGAADGARGGSPLIMAAIAGGLIAGGPLVIAAAGTVMGGIAAAIVHSAPEIEGATTSLLNAFNLDFKQAAEITIPYFVQALGTIKDSAAGLADQAAPAFAALDKPIQSLTQGVVSLATNAMPGLVSTVTQGLPVFQGLQSFLGSVGTGLSSMLTTLTSHAGAMGSTLASLGDIIGTLLSALGTLASEGAELGQAVLPALATVLGVLNTVLQAIAPVLPSIALGFAGWKVAGLLAPMLGSLATSLEDVGAKAMVSVAGMTGIEGAGIAAGTGFEVAATGARGLEAAMGPIGWVLLAIGLAVPALVSAFHSEDATQKQVKASAEAMTQALQQSKGAIDDNVRATAALQAQKNGLFDWAQKWGVSTSTVVDAMLGQQGAMETVASGAHAYADAQSRAADANLYSTDGTFELAGGYQKQAAASDAALGSLTNLAGGVKGEIANQNALTTAINGSLTPAQVNAQRLQAIANTASAASSQITLLKGALDALTGKAVTMDEAQIAVTQAVQAATTAVQGPDRGAQGRQRRAGPAHPEGRGGRAGAHRPGRRAAPRDRGHGGAGQGHRRGERQGRRDAGPVHQDRPANGLQRRRRQDPGRPLPGHPGRGAHRGHRRHLPGVPGHPGAHRPDQQDVGHDHRAGIQRRRRECGHAGDRTPVQAGCGHRWHRHAGVR
jgi:hypothetical protein